MSQCCFLVEVQRCFILVLFRYYYSIYHYLKLALIFMFSDLILVFYIISVKFLVILTLKHNSHNF